jgi:hypothetical protein
VVGALSCVPLTVNFVVLIWAVFQNKHTAVRRRQVRIFLVWCSSDGRLCRIPICILRVACCALRPCVCGRVLRYALRVTRCVLRIACCMLRVACCALHVAHCVVLTENFFLATSVRTRTRTEDLTSHITYLVLVGKLFLCNTSYVPARWITFNTRKVSKSL